MKDHIAEYAGLAIALISLGVAGTAACLWYRSSKTDTSPTWSRGDHPFEPVVREIADSGRVDGLMRGLSEAAGLNQRAALWTGASVILSAIATVLPHIPISRLFSLWPPS
jgi:hypothetical protein